MMTPIAVVAALALIASPVDDSPFCATLKQVVAAAPAGFVALKPHEAWAGAGLENWQTDVQLDDALTCGVRMAGVPHTYQCMAGEWSEPGSGDARVLADRVGTCLGLRMAGNGDPAVNGDEYAARVRGVDIRISYDLIIMHGPDQISYSHYLALRVSAGGD